MIKKCLFFIVLVIICSFFCVSDCKRDCFKFIESLERNGLYTEAIAEYKRLLFSEVLLKQEKGMIWFKLALCYRSLGEELEVINSFSKSFNYLEDNDLKNQLIIEISAFFLAKSKTEIAREMLKRIRNGGEAKQKLIALSYLIDRDWESFLGKLTEIGLSDQEIQKIKKIKTRFNRQEEKFDFLKFVNILIPGSPYILYGDFFQGTESFLTNYFTFQQILDSSTTIGGVFSVYIFLRLFLKSNDKGKQYLKNRMEQREMLLEEQIFKILFIK